MSATTSLPSINAPNQPPPSPLPSTQTPFHFLPYLYLWYTLLKGFFLDFFLALHIATPPTLSALSRTPSLIFRPRALQDVFMGFVWDVYGDGVDGGGRDVKEELVRPHARGVVFDVGAGHAHLVNYLQRPDVTAYIALEPNTHMHTRLRKRAAEAGFTESDGTLLVLPYGAEDITLIASALSEWASKYNIVAAAGTVTNGGSHNSASLGTQVQVVDTLVSILSLCSIPDPNVTLRSLVENILKPGGQLLFYEHVRSPDPHVSRAQDILRPIWSAAFGGCLLGVDGVRAVREAGGASGGGGWETLDVWPKSGEGEQTLFYHQVGRAVKRSLSQ